MVNPDVERACQCVERCFAAQERRTRVIAFTVDYCVTAVCLTVMFVALSL